MVKGGADVVDLYAHNRAAYESALRLLKKTGKAAIVHPTGTGKSYIAFQLVADHPKELILWLSPSEYIFETQCESLKRQAPEISLKNVRFYTYAKLLRMTDADRRSIAAQHPSYIILDEYHRAGEQEWSTALQKLLCICSGAKLLGLSATNIRYLDKQRNMADELFDGHIASEMTLGEAIVRGILPAPKYVTTVFQYDKDIVKYEQRVKNLRSPGLQAANEKYLEALRRALEKADGLDKVFEKYLTRGKYLVFCANVEHMNAMMARAPSWFAAVDAQPHLYSAYSDDPAASAAFSRFKADDSDHLRLLFCIDMLNEGVHVPGISGVILFRPTISPIIYKQQIGRALTSGDEGTPLIVDVVNNIEGLCSVSFLQSEMSTAIQRLYAAGEAEAVVTERFEVVEQSQDCRRLFEQLESSLSSGWEQYYQAAVRYQGAHGNLLVPKRYITPEGLSLGSWISTQRSVRSGRVPGNLSESQIMRLDALGMVWQNRLEVAWEDAFAHAAAYKEEYGNLLVPAQYLSPDGFRLGRWISNLRQQRANGERKGLLTAKRIAKLDFLGMAWNAVSEKWEKNYAEAVHYYNEHGNLNVPANYKTESGFSLGAWLRNLRRIYREKPETLDDTQITRLEAIGMLWGDRNDAQWMTAYQAAKSYFLQYGNLNVPIKYTASDGTALGKWVARQRAAYQHPEKEHGRLSPERIRLLEQIGMQWQRPGDWDDRYALVQGYLHDHGDLKIPIKYKTKDGILLGNWLYRQRRIYEGKAPGKLNARQRERLRTLLDIEK